MSVSGSLRAVVAAQAHLERSRTALREAVTEARADHTWAEVGEVLGMTRQAAFKRFGSPRDPRTGGTMSPHPAATDLVVTTEHVYRLIDGGDYDTLASLMTADTAGLLTRRLVLDIWAAVVAETGNLVGCHDTRIELPDGTPVDHGERVHGSLIGHTTLDCEAGQWVGRIAFDAEHRITGLLVVPPDHGQLPF